MDGSSERSKFKRHPYFASFGGTALGPLTAEPEIRIGDTLHEVRDYGPDGSDTEAIRIVAGAAELKLRTADIATALELAAAFAVGDDVLAPERGARLVLAPPENSGERTLVFPRAFLLPQLEYAPKQDNHFAVLDFIARPDDSGVLFTFD